MSFEELKSNVPFQKSFWNTFHRKSHNVNDWMTKVLSEVGLFSEKDEFLSEKDHHYLHFQPQVKVSHNIRMDANFHLSDQASVSSQSLL